MRLLLALLLLPLYWGLADPGVQTSRADARLLPLPAEEGVFHFVIFGDRTGGPREGVKVLAQAVADTNLLGPDLVMTVGDLVQGYNPTAAWLLEMVEYRTIMSTLKMPWYPVAGNHDIYWGSGDAPAGHHESDYERHFGPLWYRFVHKNAAFIALYSDEGDRATNRKGWGEGLNRMSEEQRSWLAATLAETKGCDHVFVFLHHPRWIGTTYPGSNWDEVHALLRGAGNVTAVFAGHIHRQRYEGRRDGIEYFTLAAVGAGMPFDAPGTGHLHHVDLVTVRKGGITIATIPVGQVIDPRTMTPEHLAEVDRVRAAVPQQGTVEIDAAGAASGVCVLTLANPATVPVDATVALEAGDDGWWVRPDHAHARIEPGGTFAFRFGYRREAGGAFEAPEVRWELEFAGAAGRVRLPESRRTAAMRLVGDLPPIDAPHENAALLDGGKRHIEVAHALCDLPDGPLTVEGWFSPEALDGQRALLAKTEQSEYGLFLREGVPRFLVWIGDAYVEAIAKAPLAEGRWQHVAGVLDGAEVRLYVGGRLAASTATPAGTRRRNPLPLLIGADPSPRGVPGMQFRGRVDEVRLSSVARYSGEGFAPARRLEADAATELLLHLDGLVGPFVPDASAHGRHVLARGGLRCER